MHSPTCFSLLSFQPSAHKYFHWGKKFSPQTLVWNDYNGGTGAGGTNRAPQRFWVPICFWPWMRFGRTLHRGYWIAAVLSVRCILLSVLGFFQSWNINWRNKCWSAIAPMSEGIRHCMNRGHAQTKMSSFFYRLYKSLQMSMCDLFLHLLCVMLSQFSIICPPTPSILHYYDAVENIQQSEAVCSD